MLTRCSEKFSHLENTYVHKGIKVCDRWHSFDAFLDDMGICPDGLTIDRIDYSGNYEPGNCRWATMKEQSNNTSRNVVLTHGGISMTATQWAESLGMNKRFVYTRLRRGWSSEDAITKPFGHKRKNIQATKDE